MRLTLFLKKSWLRKLSFRRPKRTPSASILALCSAASRAAAAAAAAATSVAGLGGTGAAAAAALGAAADSAGAAAFQVVRIDPTAPAPTAGSSTPAVPAAALTSAVSSPPAATACARGGWCVWCGVDLGAGDGAAPEPLDLLGGLDQHHKRLTSTWSARKAAIFSADSPPSEMETWEWRAWTVAVAEVWVEVRKCRCRLHSGALPAHAGPSRQWSTTAGEPTQRSCQVCKQRSFWRRGTGWRWLGGLWLRCR